MKIVQASDCAHHLRKIEVHGAHISAPLWRSGAGGAPLLTSGQCFSDIYSRRNKEVTVGNADACVTRGRGTGDSGRPAGDLGAPGEPERPGAGRAARGVASRRLHGPAGMRVQDACWCEANESEGKFLALIKFIQQDLAVHLRVVGRADIRSGGRALVRSCAHWLPGTGAECRAPGVPSGPLACRAGAPWVRDAGSVCLRAVQRCCDRTHPARTRCRDRRSYRRVREWAAPHAATVTVPQVSVWGRRGAAPPAQLLTFV
ncbi:hypothetical protein FHX80_115513 [Streptomyces brevispora]|uniref:Uncharacterized protein n=1 Tax=Streptomyces brevispora TaxID=887462 RepID=A0A561V5W7_9ACTN|nr:hypothetical protein FHX80_115513 [Streptomyces brevispora]